jgi:hypothetical protein
MVLIKFNTSGDYFLRPVTLNTYASCLSSGVSSGGVMRRFPLDFLAETGLSVPLDISI